MKCIHASSIILFCGLLQCCFWCSFVSTTSQHSPFPGVNVSWFFKFIFPWNHLDWRSPKWSYSEEWSSDLMRPWKIAFFLIHYFRQSFNTLSKSPNSRLHNRCPQASLSVGILLSRQHHWNKKRLYSSESQA